MLRVTCLISSDHGKIETAPLGARAGVGIFDAQHLVAITPNVRKGAPMSSLVPITSTRDPVNTAKLPAS
jgi:hypothetical protein